MMQATRIEQSSETTAKQSAISGLNGDSIQAVFGEPSYLDLGRNAVVNDAIPLVRMKFTINPFVPDYSNAAEHLGIDTSDGRIALSDELRGGSTITVDGTAIGSINRASDQRVLLIDFNENAAPALIQLLVRAITYTNSSENDFITASDIQILTRNAEGLTEDFLVRVMTTPAVTHPDEFILTNGTDIFQGTDGGDTFYCTMGVLGFDDAINGGAGDDTFALYIPDNSTSRVVSANISDLSQFTGIEFIDGTTGDDTIRIRADQLGDVREIAGFEGEDRLQITGMDIDFTSINILDFEDISLTDDNAIIKFSNTETAKLVSGYLAQGETVIITNGTLTNDERMAIHRRGIDTIITEQDGITTTHHAPEVTALDGDQIRITAGETVFVDVDRDSLLADDDGIFDHLGVKIASGTGEGDILRLDTPAGGPISISNGYQNFSLISVNGTEIGAFTNFTNDTHLDIQFNENATPELVLILLHALTYTNTNGSVDGQRIIEVSLGDIGGRTTSATVTVAPWEWSATQVTEGAVSGTKVGALSGEDAGGHILNYILVGGSEALFVLEENSDGGFDVKVKTGVVLDYETTAHRNFTVMISDGTHTTERTFKLSLEDVNENPEVSFAPVTISEGADGGTSVGTLTAADPEGAELQYTLSAESEEFFELVSDENGGYIVAVRDGVTLDYETPAHHSFTVIVSDGLNDVEKSFTLDLHDVNEAPSLTFNSIMVSEGVNAGTIVGTLVVQDVDGPSLEYNLTGASAALFELEQTAAGTFAVKVKTGVILDYETLAHHSFTVSVSDGTNRIVQTFDLNLQNVNEAPGLTFNSVRVSEGVGAGTVVGTLVVQDVDGPSLEYSLTGASAALFELEETEAGTFAVKVKAGVTLDYEALAHHHFTVSVSDGTNTINETYTLDLTNIDERPTLTFTSLAVSEGSGGGTVVGRLSASDPEGKTLSYTLLGASADLYSLVADPSGGYKVVIKNGVVLDYENSAHHTLTVAVSDGTHTIREMYDLNLADVIDVVTGTRGKDILRGQSGADIIKGLAGDDKLFGNSGNDTLWGGAGSDTLTGSSGRDVFAFDTRLNKDKDKVTDFQVSDDSFWLDNAIFTKLGRLGSEARPSQLKPDYFTTGTHATKKNHYIIYDKKGTLYYDADGSGSKYKQVVIATLSKNLGMTHENFFVI